LSSDVLGRVVEVATGVPLDQHLSRTIFEPLAMRRAYYFVPPEERDTVVSRYSRTGEAIHAMPRDACEWGARYVSGGGGLHTTIGDYARFSEALLGGGDPILSRGSVQAMTTNQVGHLNPFGFRWGFSLALSTPDARGRTAIPVGGFGWYGIFGTWFWAMPQLQAAVLMFANILRADMTLPLFGRVVEDAVSGLGELAR
jgi:CubicO group peptidase (beta-lactamase class C family)